MKLPTFCRWHFEIHFSSYLWILFQRVQLTNNSALDQVMVWCSRCTVTWTNDYCTLTHIFIMQNQWVNTWNAMNYHVTSQPCCFGMKMFVEIINGQRHDKTSHLLPSALCLQMAWVSQLAAKTSADEMLFKLYSFIFTVGFALGLNFLRPSLNTVQSHHQHWSRDHFVYAPSQRETTLHCNVVSHWLGTYTKMILAESKWMY